MLHLFILARTNNFWLLRDLCTRDVWICVRSVIVWFSWYNVSNAHSELSVGLAVRFRGKVSMQWMSKPMCGLDLEHESCSWVSVVLPSSPGFLCRWLLHGPHPTSCLFDPAPQLNPPLKQTHRHSLPCSWFSVAPCSGPWCHLQAIGYFFMLSLGAVSVQPASAGI